MKKKCEPYTCGICCLPPPGRHEMEEQLACIMGLCPYGRTMNMDAIRERIYAERKQMVRDKKRKERAREKERKKEEAKENAFLPNVSPAMKKLRYNKLTPVQADAKAMILRYRFNVMVTLTFSSKGGVSLTTAASIFGRFVGILRRTVFGKDSKRILPMIPVVEGSFEQLGNGNKALGMRERTHIHCLLQLDGDPLDYKEVVRAVWVKTSGRCGNPDVYCPNSDDWFIPLATEEERHWAASYLVKGFKSDTLGLLVNYIPPA